MPEVPEVTDASGSDVPEAAPPEAAEAADELRRSSMLPKLLRRRYPRWLTTSLEDRGCRQVATSQEDAAEVADEQPVAEADS